jgi:hypothetical protein
LIDLMIISIWQAQPHSLTTHHSTSIMQNAVTKIIAQDIRVVFLNYLGYNK